MELKRKAKILTDLYVTVKHMDTWRSFLTYADLGVPLAIAWNLGYVDLKPEAENLIEDAYSTLLTVLELPDVDYADLSAVFDAATEDEGEDNG